MPVPGRLAAVALRGRIACSGPVETFPLQLPMSLPSRLALATSGARLRLAVVRYGRIAAPRPGEPAADRQARMLAFMDDRSFSEFIGRLPADVDAVYRATLTRSSGEPEQLAAGYGVGYFHLVWNRSAGLSRVIVGGSGRLIEGLASPLGDRIRLGCEVESVTQDEQGVEVRCRSDGVGRTLRARAAVVAAPAPVARRIVQGLPEATARALESIRYGPYAVVAFLTDEQIVTRWDSVYALATPGRPFSMLFNMANVLRPADETGADGQHHGLRRRGLGRPHARAGRRRDRRGVRASPWSTCCRTCAAASAKPSSSAGRRGCRIRTSAARRSSRR